MSVMQKSQLEERALELAGMLQIEIPQNCDPFQPFIILSALEILFPEAEVQLRTIKRLEEEEQWNCLLEFIEINLLEGQRLDIQELGEQEIGEIYMLLIEFTEHAIRENQSFQEQQNQPLSSKPNEQRNPINKGQEKLIGKQQQLRKVSKDKEFQQKIEEKKNKEKKRIQQSDKVNIQKRQENIVKKKKEKSRSKEKSKQKSQSKSKNKDLHNRNAKKQQIKASPSKSKTIKKLFSNQPLQNEAIKEITTAMSGNRKKPNNKVLLKDPKSTEEVMKAKRQFDYYLNEFKREGKAQHKLKAKSQKEPKKEHVDEHFMKALQKKQKHIQETVINEQIKYFLALRDKKLGFINKIHKLTEKLERERIIEKDKEQRRLMQEQRVKTQGKIQQGNALFNKNMQLLKENNKVIRQKNELQSYDERIICKEMEQCMKKKKLDELQELKLLWEQENLKLNNIMGDEQKIKNKLIDIYRKNRP